MNMPMLNIYDNLYLKFFEIISNDQSFQLDNFLTNGRKVLLIVLKKLACFLKNNGKYLMI